MRNIVVVGGGAAGLFAALAASEENSVVLLEKNEKLGKKLYITGKGRCNLTNAVPVAEFLNNVTGNPKFLYGALSVFSPSDTMNFFETNGCKLKTERGNRVFPESDKASDVTKTLVKALEKRNVKIYLDTEVTDIDIKEDKVVGIRHHLLFLLFV